MNFQDISAKSRLDSKDLTCLLCLHHFEDPRVLPCHHSYCLKCLKHLCDLSKQNQSSSGKHKISCPKCKTSFLVPSSGPESFPVDTKIKAFKDYVIKELAHNISERIQSTKDETPAYREKISKRGAATSATPNARETRSAGSTRETNEEKASKRPSSFSRFSDISKFAKYFVQDEELGRTSSPSYRPTIRADHNRLGYETSCRFRNRRPDRDIENGFDVTSNVRRRTWYGSGQHSRRAYSLNRVSNYGDVYYTNLAGSSENLVNICEDMDVDCKVPLKAKSSAKTSTLSSDPSRPGEFKLKEDEFDLKVGATDEAGLVRTDKDASSTSNCSNSKAELNPGQVHRNKEDASWNMNSKASPTMNSEVKPEARQSRKLRRSSLDKSPTSPEAQSAMGPSVGSPKLKDTSIGVAKLSGVKKRPTLPVHRENVITQNFDQENSLQKEVGDKNLLNSQKAATSKSKSSPTSTPVTDETLKPKLKLRISKGVFETLKSTEETGKKMPKTPNSGATTPVTPGTSPNTEGASSVFDRLSTKSSRTNTGQSPKIKQSHFEKLSPRSTSSSQQSPKSKQFHGESQNRVDSRARTSESDKRATKQGADDLHFVSNNMEESQKHDKMFVNNDPKNSVGDNGQPRVRPSSASVKDNLFSSDKGQPQVRPRSATVKDNLFSSSSKQKSGSKHKSRGGMRSHSVGPKYSLNVLDFENRMAFKEHLLNMTMSKQDYEKIMSDFKNGNLRSRLDSTESVLEKDQNADSPSQMKGDVSRQSEDKENSNIFSEENKSPGVVSDCQLNNHMTALSENSVSFESRKGIKGIKKVVSLPAKMDTDMPEMKDLIQNFRIKYSSTLEKKEIRSSLTPVCSDGVVRKWCYQKTEFGVPTSMTITLKGCAVVAEYGNSCLEYFDADGQFEHKVDGIKPFGILTNQQGHIVVGDRKGKAIRVFDEYGADIAQWDSGTFGWISGIGLLQNGNLVVCDRDRCRLGIYTSGGQKISEFGSYGVNNKQLCMADFLTVDSKNRIIVADSGNHCLKVFDSNGLSICTMGSRGNSDGSLEWPKGICVDSNDNIIVADMHNSRICQFSPDGKFIRHLVQSTPDPYNVCFGRGLVGVIHYSLKGFSQYDVYCI